MGTAILPSPTLKPGLLLHARNLTRLRRYSQFQQLPATHGELFLLGRIVLAQDAGLHPHLRYSYQLISTDGVQRMVSQSDLQKHFTWSDGVQAPPLKLYFARFRTEWIDNRPPQERELALVVPTGIELASVWQLAKQRADPAWPATLLLCGIEDCTALLTHLPAGPCSTACSETATGI